jgi:hypothetical protein
VSDQQEQHREEDQPFSPLVGALITRMFEDSASINSRVIENLEHTVDTLTAELYAIRTGVAQLIDQPWTPSNEAIRGAVFFPSKQLVDEYHANKEVSW